MSAPSAPTNVTAMATGTSGAVRVTWTAPTSTGGAPVTSYAVTPYVSGSARPATVVPGNATTTTVTALVNGSAYTFTVTATNADGSGAASAPSGSATPSAAPGGGAGSVIPVGTAIGQGIARLLNRDVVIVRAAVTNDRYGGTVPDWDSATRTITAANVQPSGAAESNIGRAEQVADFVCFLPPGTNVVGTDRIEIEDVPYQVIGPAAQLFDLTGPHHVMVNLRMVEG